MKKVRSKSADYAQPVSNRRASNISYTCKSLSRSLSFDFHMDSEEINEPDSLSSQKEMMNEPVQEMECMNVKTFGGEVYRKKGYTGYQSSSPLLSEPIKFSENIKKITREMDEETTQLILNCLKKHCIFATMGDLQMKLILGKMFPCHIDYQQFIFKQGDSASLFFVIERGTMEVIIDGNSKKYLVKGDSFGELALIYNAPRSASIRCLDKDSVLWTIDRLTFRVVLEDILNRDFETNRRFLEGVLALETISEQQKEELAKALIILTYAKNQIIVNEGDQSNSFYIIKEGIVHVYKGESYIRSMRSGESFGESALLLNTPRQMTIRASPESEVIVLALAKDRLVDILKDQVHVIAYKNLQKWAFSKSSVLSALTIGQREKVIEKMKMVNFNHGEAIIAKGKEISKIVILLNGEIVIEGQKKVFEPGTIFFDDVLAKNNKVISEDNYISKGKGKCTVAEISFSAFLHELGGNLEEILSHKEKPHEKKIQIYKNQRRVNKMISLLINELIYVSKIGEGQFGEVFLVSSQKDNHYYALKVLNKKRLIENNSEKHAKEEKKIHELVTFPFIVDYFRTFKDEDNIYFLFEYIDGVTLADILNTFGIFETYQAQFYLGSIILALEYLHHHNIVHRDIKPENIMIDKSGFPKIVDLGIGKMLTYKSGTSQLRTYTLVGTPHYMAPEIPKSKGYNLAVDYWSLGVCLYQFMCGYLPFGNGCNDPYEIYEEIAKKEVKFPGSLKDLDAKRLMNQLLSKIPEVRLGGSFMNLKSDPWFSTFDWDKLLEKEIQPNYVPPIKDAVNMRIHDFIKKNNKSIQQYLQEEKKATMSDGEGQQILMVKQGWDEIF